LAEHLQMMIDGKWVDGAGGTRAILNPFNGEVIAHVGEADTKQVNEAVLAAKKAFLASRWATDVEQTSSRYRRTNLHGWKQRTLVNR
jgi:phenylacetaldehyde dehydrogenase